MTPDAEVRIPAEKAYVAVVRMAAAGIAARLDFTLDDVEDLRMAVGEACALVLAGAAPGGSLTVRFRLAADRIDLEVAADSTQTEPPDTQSFAWQVLNTTATDVSASAADGLVTVALSLVRDPASQPA